MSINIFTEWENVESLDSSCVASVDEPKVFLDTNSAMMIRIEKKGCENGCAANVNIAATISMLNCRNAIMETGGTCPGGCTQDSGICENPKCTISLDSKRHMELRHVGLVYTGGLGAAASNDQDGYFRMWMCVRDWNWVEMRSCGVGLGQFACFRFNEISGEYVYWGTAKELRMISAEKYDASFSKEGVYIPLLCMCGSTRVHVRSGVCCQYLETCARARPPMKAHAHYAHQCIHAQTSERITVRKNEQGASIERSAMIPLNAQKRLVGHGLSKRPVSSICARAREARTVGLQ